MLYQITGTITILVLQVIIVPLKSYDAGIKPTNMNVFLYFRHCVLICCAVSKFRSRMQHVKKRVEL